MGVVAATADLGVGFASSLDVGADPAEPEQIDPRLQDRCDQCRWAKAFRVDVEQRPCFGRQRNLLLGARKNAASLRDQPWVVIRNWDASRVGKEGVSKCRS